MVFEFLTNRHVEGVRAYENEAVHRLGYLRKEGSLVVDKTSPQSGDASLLVHPHISITRFFPGLGPPGPLCLTIVQ